jgi:hypothetical protein
MSQPTYQVITLPRVGTAAAGADEIARIGVNASPIRLVLTKLSFVPDTAVTANDTNSGTLTVKIGATTIATLTTNVAQGNLVAGTPVTLTMSGDLTVAAGAVLSVTKTYAGSGAVLSGIVVAQALEIRD